MTTAIKVAIAAGAITLAAISVWGCFGLNHAAIIALDRWGAAAPTVGKTDAVLDHLNRPCKGASGPDACGTLAQINKTAIDAGDAIVRTQLIERSTQPHIIAAMDEFGQTAKHLSSTADSLKGTADALTGTAQGATDTLAEGKRTIAAAQPLLAAYTQSGNDMDALIKRKAIGDLLDNLAGVTAHGNAIAGDFQQVADKARADYLRPVPWYMQPIKKSSQLIDIGAAIARHTP
jgi:hypothetical protein